MSAESTTNVEDARAKRKAELLREKAEREKQTQAEAEDHEMLCLELEAKYTSELGSRGVFFEIVNEENSLGVGPIVVKGADDVALKSWELNEETPETRAKLATACVVHPANFTEVTRNRPILVKRCVLAIIALAGARSGPRTGKY
ncbi:MAG TPA: hypothetical protein VKU41_18105 [Polyangiaceae bacterium]|nr:hypothetical protein [Polyangiaceae bacterium]